MSQQPKSFYLFMALLAMLLLYPLATLNMWTQFIFRCLFTGILLMGLYAISDNRNSVMMGVLLVIPSLVTNVLALLFFSPGMLIATLVTGLVFFVYLVGALLRHVLRDHAVSADTIYCAVAIYLLVAMVFAVAYVLIEYTAPGSIKGDFHPNSYFRFAFPDGFYFSFCTLTTVGYGDLIPVASEARCLVILESVFGVLYPSILIARLVGMYASEKANQGRDQADLTR